jgi:Gram-negative bacterial TonB protein C-terminal/PilZ domain
MSTAQQVPASASPLERRFYPRIAPRTPTFVAFEETNRALLLNVSENGLLVSIPAVLPRNFVARALVSLNGLPTPVRVNVRVIWVSEGRKQAGIQLLDLSDHDRDQIRKWGAQESAPSVQTQPRPRVVAGPSATPSEATQAKPSVVAPPPLNRPRNLPPPSRRVAVRTRSTSATAGMVLWGVLAATVCFGAVFFLKHGAPSNLSARSTEDLRESLATPSPEAQGTPQNPGLPEPGPVANPASLASSWDTAKSESAPPHPSTARRSSQTHDDLSPDATGEDPDHPQVLVLDTTPPRRDASQMNSAPSSRPTSQLNPVPDAPRPVAQTQLDPPNDPSLNRALPAVTADASKAGSGTSSSSTPGDVTPGTLSAVPNPPAAKQTLPNPIRPNEVFPSASTMLSLSPIIASTRPASSRRSDTSVVQMDAPVGPALEIRPPSRYHSSFYNLPGERVLESPSLTIHIQRSVRMPPAHAWWPLNRNKKVVVGELVSRVDPLDAQVQIGSVRVNATVSADGHIENVRPINGPANLVPSVVKAVHEWRYQPTLMDGKPVETECHVVVQFHPSPNRTARP